MAPAQRYTSLPCLLLLASAAFGQNSPAAPKADSSDKASAYYNYSLGHMYAELATSTGNRGEYFNRAVRPLLTVDDETPTEMPLRRRLALLQDAAALVNPITWREPFGLVMAEALASATPVLAFPNGAAPEIVDPGRTGFLCRDEDEMVEAVDRIKEIDRDQCRGAAERRFSLQRMARDHERFYRRVLDREVMDRLPAAGESLVSA